MRTLRTVLLTLGLLGALPATLRGAGGPCTASFDALAKGVDDRAALVPFPTTPAQKAEKKGLAKAHRALARRSTSFRKDAGTVAVVGRTLLDLYPGQVAVENLVKGALDGLRADLVRERNDLALTADELNFGILQDRALAGVAAADLSLDADGAADPLDLDARPDALGTAALALEKAFRGALPGRDGRRRRTFGDELWVDQDGELLWIADRVTASYQDSSDMFLISGIRSRNPADDSKMDIVVKNVFGVGSYSLDFDTGTWFDAPFTQYGFVESGTLTITALDTTRGTAEGTFTLTARGCIFDCSTYTVTGGRFRIRNLLLP